MLTDRERHFAEVLMDVIDQVDRPMLVYTEEKEVVKKALELILSIDENERRGR